MGPGLTTLLSKLDGVRETSRGWSALCPHHEDNHPSLDVSEGDNGDPVMICRAGCKNDDILGKIGLNWADLLDSTQPKVQPKRKARYQTPKGDLLDTVYRELLARLTLSTDHEQHLRDRGLSHAAIGWGMFRSLDPVSVAKALESLESVYGPDRLSEVPGVVAGNDGRLVLSVREGLAIPVFGLGGTIRAIKVRVSGSPKYVWLSSPKASSGAPAYVPPVDRGAVDRVRLTEGELKAIISTDRGVPAVSVSGVSSWSSAIPALRGLGVSKVWVAFDSDFRTNPAVRSALRECLRTLRQIGLEVEVETWEGFKGVDDAIVGGAEITAVPVAEFLRGLSVYDKTEDSTWEVLSLASDLRIKPVQWVWPGWLPQGALSILDGDPGLGKSQLSLSIAAYVSRGRPVGSKINDVDEGNAGEVLVLSAEDDAERTLVPRLLASGADLRSVRLLRYFAGVEGRRLPSLPDDFDKIEDILSNGKYRLVIIDPLMAYLGSEVDSHRDQEVRRVLSRLSQIAEENQVAVLAVRHLNKSGGNAAIYRGGGSIGIIGTARVGWMVGTGSDGDNVLAVTKSNLAAKPKSRRYRVEPVEVSHNGVTVQTSAVRWLGESDTHADELLGRTHTAKRESIDALFVREVVDNDTSHKPRWDWAWLKDWARSVGKSPTSITTVPQAVWDRHGIRKTEEGLECLR